MIDIGAHFVFANPPSTAKLYMFVLAVLPHALPDDQFCRNAGKGESNVKPTSTVQRCDLQMLTGGGTSASRW
jgi:hypothetical protein